MRQQLWKSNTGDSLEYFSLTHHKTGFLLAGTVVLQLDNQPACVQYEIECNAAWQTQSVRIHQQLAGKTSLLNLNVLKGQSWQSNDEQMPFKGVYDVDLEISPATNTLPIRRLNLNIGETQQVQAVWVRFPGLKLETLTQNYRRISDTLYHYQALNFETHLEVDELGLVTQYHGLWARIRR